MSLPHIVYLVVPCITVLIMEQAGQSDFPSYGRRSTNIRAVTSLPTPYSSLPSSLLINKSRQHVCIYNNTFQNPLPMHIFDIHLVDIQCLFRFAYCYQQERVEEIPGPGPSQKQLLKMTLHISFGGCQALLRYFQIKFVTVTSCSEVSLFFRKTSKT